MEVPTWNLFLTLQHTETERGQKHEWFAATKAGNGPRQNRPEKQRWAIPDSAFSRSRVDKGSQTDPRTPDDSTAVGSG